MKAVGFVAVLLAFAQSLALGSAPTSQPVGPEDIDRLVSELEAPAYAVREAAQQKLLQVGAPAAGALKAALQSGRLGPEGQKRAESVLFRVEVPEFGAVWRGRRGAQSPLNLRDGDIIVAVNGMPVRSTADLTATAHGGGDLVEVTVHSPGKGRTKAPVTPGELSSSGFLDWPDSLELYARFGTKGPWDSKVTSAFRLTIAGDPAASEAFQAAWQAGCRDVLVLASWLGSLLSSGAAAEAEGLIANADPLPPDPYPGGLCRYGSLAGIGLELDLRRGRVQEAAVNLEKALQQAQRADAWGAIGLLRRAQLGMKLAGPPAEALAFWEEHAAAIRRCPLPLTSRLLAPMAACLASEGDPKAALDFLAGQQDSIVGQSLKRYYDGQAALAKQAAALPAASAHLALVGSFERIGPISATLDHYASHKLGELATPAALEGEMRMSAFPPARSSFESVVTAGLERQGPMLLSRLTRYGSFLDEYTGLGCDGHPVSASAGDPQAWQAFRVECGPVAGRISHGGNPARAIYYGPVGAGAATVTVSCSGATAEFRNLKLYAGSPVQVDNAELGRLMDAQTLAEAKGDLKAARTAHEAIRERLGQVPGAKIWLDRADWRFRRFEEMMAQEGLLLCRQEILESSQQAQGRWNFEDGQLVAHRAEQTTESMLKIPLSLQNFELTGLAEIDSPNGEGDFVVIWNSLSPYSHVPGVNNLIAICRQYEKVVLGGNADEKNTFYAERDLRGPIPFCLRVRGKSVAFFVRDPAKPALRRDDVEPTGPNLILCGWTMTHEGARIRFGQMVVRHLADNVDISSPATLSKPPGPAAPVTPTAPPR